MVSRGVPSISREGRHFPREMVICALVMVQVRRSPCLALPLVSDVRWRTMLYLHLAVTKTAWNIPHEAHHNIGALLAAFDTLPSEVGARSTLS